MLGVKESSDGDRVQILQRVTRGFLRADLVKALGATDSDSNFRMKISGISSVKIGIGGKSTT